jgi:mRNA interferase YafQ
MRIVKYTSRFKRDYRREKSGPLGKKLDRILMEIVDMLATDQPLPRRAFDHALTGEWRDHRDCHVRPDFRRARHCTALVAAYVSLID